MLTLAEGVASNTTNHLPIHKLISQELIKLIRKNPALFDEYRTLVSAQILEHQERMARKAAKK